eukprot:TRINITY_DN28729_c0_g1_i1.p1 TRINITY_DN28729_c0_g1~~TRINITY_DN28729_c0_g1_i1.p1  ORF type:complete len:140 (-),score=14.07 TRINITY_DN28729_c0_g1_i1:65-484(-)
MLLVIGPVTKQHMYLAGATAGGGAVVTALGVALNSLGLALGRLVFFGGLLSLLAGIMMLMFFGCMVQSYGWRQEASRGGTTTVWSCQYCAARFQTYQACEAHEGICQLGPTPVMNDGATVVGQPVGQPLPVVQGQVVQP